MSEYAHLTKKMFESLEDIEAGRFVYVIAIKASVGRDGAVEDVIIGKTSDPRLALEHFCRRTGNPMENRLCLPVILPPGLNADAVRGFRSIRTKTAMWIEYTGEK